MILIDQFNALSLKDQVATIKAFKAIVVEKRQALKASKEAQKAARASIKAERQAAAIVKAQARLQKLLEKQAAPVGIKAVKANKRPSKVVSYGAEANALAETIKAGKSTI